MLKQKRDAGSILVTLALRDMLKDCENVLDVGCGTSPLLRTLGVKKATGFEGYQPDFEEAKRRNTQDEIVYGDAKNLTSHFAPKQFDACIAMDVIEHFTKDAGLKLMKDMESLAKKKVIFFTPNGFLPQRNAANDDLQAHFSGWEVDEMRRFGYDVMGQLGPKTLRGEWHALKRKPAIFWGVVSLVQQVTWVHGQPEKAAAILCAKDMTKA